MRRNFFFYIFSILFILFLTNQNSLAQQQESIKRFVSDIIIHQNGSLTVTETIQVYAAGTYIKHGIYRDFPTIYKDSYGNNFTVGFKVIKTLRDNQPEPFFIQPQSNGKRIYLGQESSLVTPGVHTYVIQYETNKQLGFFKDFDELYWNVTGNGWIFPIEYAEANITLPSGATAKKYVAYTGSQGAKESDYHASYTGGSTITFTTTKTLQQYEGLTVALSWPKGFVTEPTEAEKATSFLKDNLSVVISLVVLMIILGYYLYIWSKVGKDPQKSTIIPLFSPPKGISPSGARFISKMKYDNKALTATILNLAVKRYLTITEKDGTFILKRLIGSTTQPLSKNEQSVADSIFTGKKDSIVIEHRYNPHIGTIRNADQESLKSQYEKTYFVLNTGHFIKGILLSFAAAIAISFSANQIAPAIFISIWLTGWSFGCAALLFMALTQWKSVFSGSRKIGSTLFITLFSLPFFGGEIAVLILYSQLVSPISAAILLCIILTNVVFYHLLKAPTLLGRKIMDQIEGFKLFLSVTDRYRFEQLHPPTVTTEVFEKYLPYAVALDVEHEWSETFARSLAQAHQPEYRPSWYVGSRSWNTVGTAAFASSFSNNFSSAIAASSTKPGSSSGSGGGGSSGGGGGGGGGGGW